MTKAGSCWGMLSRKAIHQRPRWCESWLYCVFVQCASVTESDIHCTRLSRTPHTAAADAFGVMATNLPALLRFVDFSIPEATDGVSCRDDLLALSLPLLSLPLSVITIFSFQQEILAPKTQLFQHRCATCTIFLVGCSFYSKALWEVLVPRLAWEKQM